MTSSILDPLTWMRNIFHLWAKWKKPREEQQGRDLYGKDQHEAHGFDECDSLPSKCRNDPLKSYVYIAITPILP